MDVFRDDQLLRSAIIRALTIWPNRYSANASCLRRMLKSFPSTASVSNFKPVIAKAIIARYSKPGDLILDFCSGYGGRLLGCLTLPRKYIGVEPSKKQVQGLNRMIGTLRPFLLDESSANIFHGCAEDQLTEFSSRSVDLVFSSPPYFDWEKYATHPTQSFIRYRTYPQWLEKFLIPVIAHSSRVLKKRGRLILNVTNGNRNPTRDEVVRIANVQGLALERTYYMTLPKLPYLHPRNGRPQKSEYILVFSRVNR